MKNQQQANTTFRVQPIRILQVAGRMNRGGAETMLMNIYRNIDRSRIQFDFVSFSGEGAYDNEIRELGGRVFYLDTPKVFGPIETVARLVGLMRKYGPFAGVHAHTLYNIGIVLEAARIARIELRIAHSHNTQDAPSESFVRKMYHQVMRKLIEKNSTCYLACGDEAGKYLFGDVFKRQGRVIPNAVDVEKFTSVHVEEINTLRKELMVAEDILTICHVARMSEVKNHKFSIEIAKYLVERGYKFRLFLIGDGVLREKLIALVKENGLEDYVIFLGVRTDIPQLLKMCDVFLMPSLFEGLPVAIVEAQAAGLQCVVSSEITQEADMGIGLIKYLSLDEPVSVWADEIISRKAISRKSNEKIQRIFIEKGYDVKTSVLDITKLYEQLGDLK